MKSDRNVIERIQIDFKAIAAKVFEQFFFLSDMIIVINMIIRLHMILFDLFERRVYGFALFV